MRSFIFNTVFIGMKSQGTFVRESSMLSLAMYHRESIIKFFITFNSDSSVSPQFQISHCPLLCQKRMKVQKKNGVVAGNLQKAC